MSQSPPHFIRSASSSQIIGEKHQLVTAIGMYKKALGDDPAIETPEGMRAFLAGIATVMSMNAKKIGKGYTALELRELVQSIDIVPMRIVFLDIVLDKTIKVQQEADQAVGRARLSLGESNRLTGTLSALRTVRDEFTPVVIVPEKPLTETTPKKKRRPKRTPQPKAE